MIATDTINEFPDPTSNNRRPSCSSAEPGKNKTKNTHDAHEVTAHAEIALLIKLTPVEVSLVTPTIPAVATVDPENGNGKDPPSNFSLTETGLQSSVSHLWQ